MRKLLYTLSFLLLALSSTDAQNNKPAKVLLIVGGEYHNYEQLPATLTQNLKAKLNGILAIDFTISKDLGLLRRAELSKYDALMMNVCEQTPLNSDEKNGFLDRIREGMPLIALHCTFWSFQDWPEFKQVLGAFVPGHQHFGTFCLETTQSDSPILRGLPSTFDLTDEPYIVNDRSPELQVLVRTCKPLQDPSGPEPEVWTKSYGKGRVFAMTFGHDAQAQENPNYLALLANGLLWALGQSK